MPCKLAAIIEQDKNGVFAYCPELRGCHTQGNTVEEALVHLREAAELYLDTLKPAELRWLSSKTIFATSLEVARQDSTSENRARGIVGNGRDLKNPLIQTVRPER